MQSKVIWGSGFELQLSVLQIYAGIQGLVQCNLCDRLWLKKQEVWDIPLNRTFSEKKGF